MCGACDADGAAGCGHCTGGGGHCCCCCCCFGCAGGVGGAGGEPDGGDVDDGGCSESIELIPVPPNTPAANDRRTRPAYSISTNPPRARLAAGNRLFGVCTSETHTQPRTGPILIFLRI